MLAHQNNLKHQKNINLKQNKIKKFKFFKNISETQKQTRPTKSRRIINSNLRR